MGSFIKQPVRLTLISFSTILLTMVLFTSATAQEGDDSELLQQGAQVFAENCAACHGEDGQGRIGATLAKNWSSIRPDLQIQDTIERGIEGTFMPPWGMAFGGPLDNDQIEAVTRYILSWESGRPSFIYPTPTIDTRIVLTPPPGVSGDPNAGAQLYATNCAVCHGPNGEGRIGATLAREWSSTRPDLLVKSVIENGVEGAAMPAWSQANGGPLSEEEIDNIVAYILTWSGPASTPGSQEQVVGPLTGWPAWILFIGAFILIIVVIVYYSRQRNSAD
ncbi:MAG: c-type cytochrome [Anaerolineales bacterium]|jgi:mono/diheme cytochrome c family protein